MPPTRVLLTAAVCLLLLFAVPAVAAQEDSPGGDIVIEPTDDSVATVEDGEIKISVDVVPYSKSSVDEAFRIRSTGDDEQRVWVSSDVDGVEFHRSDTGEAVERVRLDPGESVGVGLTVDSTQDLDGEYFTIRIESEDDESASIGITDVTVEPEEIVAGETATVSATVENSGDARGIQTVRLEVDETVVAQRDVRLSAGERQVVTFERTFEQVGAFDVSVSTVRGVTIYTTSAGRMVVREPPDGPAFEVTEASLSATNIDPGDAVDVTATVANVGDQDGTFTAELAVDGIVYQSKPVTVAAGEEATVTFTRQFTRGGTLSVSVSGADAGTVTVGSSGGTVQETAQRYLANPATATVGVAALFGLLAIGRSSIWELVRRYV
ncbi:CARDB domain-containing protein [Natronoarchaeum sp. GCM10025703]|uniref:CARDB domain-containing protein n=1 Tax=unclassified Natronoarchaeum TaxID=2620183 RepID=UPI00361F8A1A